MKLLPKILTGALVALMTSGAAHASSVGFIDRGGSFALFDVFMPEGVPVSGLYTPLTVTHQGPAAEGGGQATRGADFSAAISVDMEGGRYLTSSGFERIYQGLGATDAPFLLSIDGVANTDISGFSLQLKYNLGSAGDINTFFSVTLNGSSATSVQNRGVASDNGYTIMEFAWTGLALEQNDAFTFAITGGEAHASLDAVRLEVIPEPSTYALLAIAGAGIALVRRRRKSA